MSATESIKRIPDHVPPELVIDFDACNDPAMKIDVFARLDAIRQKAPPIAYSPYNGGHWMAFEEEDIQTILTSPDTFSTAHLTDMSVSQGGPRFIPLGIEPPEHGAWRSMLTRHFGPVKMKQLEGAARTRAHELIANIAQQKQCNFVADVAEPMPITLFMELMGLPLERFSEFRGWALEILDPEGLYSPEEQQKRMGSTGKVMQMLGEVIAARHQEPKDDLISALIQENVRGEPIAPYDLMGVCYVLFLGGLDTVTNAVSFSMRLLAQEPALQEELRQHPERIKDTLEWLMRRSAFVNVQRSVRQETVFKGVNMKPGDMIWNIVWSGSNKPGEDLRHARHLAFGTGHHLCLGMHLAKLELRVMLETWFELIGPFRLSENQPPEMIGGPIMHMKKLVLEYEPKETA